MAHLGWIEVHRVIAREHVGEIIQLNNVEKYQKNVASAKRPEIAEFRISPMISTSSGAILSSLSLISICQ